MSNQPATSTNTSSIESQRQVRIAKMNTLRERGFEPYPVDSQHDFEIGFIKFWFDFVHKFDFDKLAPDENCYLLEYFLVNVLFPPSLIETVEEKLQIRHQARQLGFDPNAGEDPEEERFDQELADEMKSLLALSPIKSRDQKEKLLAQYLKSSVDEENESGVDSFAMDSLYPTLAPHQQVTLAGRVKRARKSGKIAFVALEDESCPEGFQCIFKTDILNMSFAEMVNAKFASDEIKLKLGL